MVNIFVCGRMHSGKTTVAEYLENKYKNARIFSLAGRLKRLLKALEVDENLAFEYAMGTILGSVSNWDLATFENASKIKKIFADTLAIENEALKPRKRLRFLGTEGFRNQIHQDIWIASMVDEINFVQKCVNPKLALTITDDVRFLNEFSRLVNYNFIPIVLDVSKEMQEKRHADLGFSPMTDDDFNSPSEAGISEIIGRLKDAQLTDCIFNADEPLEQMLEKIESFITKTSGETKDGIIEIQETK